MKTRVVSIKIDNVRTEDRLVLERDYEVAVEAVYCVFIDKNGPDAHVMIDYLDTRYGGRHISFLAMKLGRRIKVRRVFP